MRIDAIDQTKLADRVIEERTEHERDNIALRKELAAIKEAVRGAAKAGYSAEALVKLCGIDAEKGEG